MHRWDKGNTLPGAVTFRETFCLTKLMMSEVGMGGSKFTGMVQNWCVFSPSSCYSGQVEFASHGGCKIVLLEQSTLTTSTWELLFTPTDGEIVFEKLYPQLLELCKMNH